MVTGDVGSGERIYAERGAKNGDGEENIHNL